MTTAEYQCFKIFLEQTCGILLGEGKQYLIDSRLTRLLRIEKIASISALLALIEQPSQRHLREAVINAMTTNETSWFRDQGPFTLLKQTIFPELEKQNKIGFRVWSAGCSSGQEPYTISITLNEYLASMPQSKLRQTQILASDISSSMIEQAKSGQYDDYALERGLTDDHRQHYFSAVSNTWVIREDIKGRVSFMEQNLLSSYNGLGKFDIIFCRNVLIYFSQQRKTDILQRLSAALNPGGYLFLGASETTMGYSDKFEMVRNPSGVSFKLKS
tara:strand:- start:758 stop:1576 length:819 start_codon:yes stop_codon:yes gene_type:complete